MSTTPSTPSDGERHGPVEPADAPPAGTALPGAGAGAGGPRNGAGVGALVSGVLALLSFLVFPPGVLVFGIAAVVLGIMGIRRAKQGEATNKSQATGGLVAGIVAVVGFAVLTVVFFVQNREDVAEFTECVDAASTEEEREECQRRLEEDIGR